MLLLKNSRFSTQESRTAFCSLAWLPIVLSWYVLLNISDEIHRLQVQLCSISEITEMLTMFLVVIARLHAILSACLSVAFC